MRKEDSVEKQIIQGEMKDDRGKSRRADITAEEMVKRNRRLNCVLGVCVVGRQPVVYKEPMFTQWKQKVITLGTHSSYTVAGTLDDNLLYPLSRQLLVEYCR